MVIGVDTIQLEDGHLEVGHLEVGHPDDGDLEARARSASHPGIMGP
jgi:hypothetical protein